MARGGAQRVLQIMVRGLILSDWQGHVRGILLLWPPVLLVLLWQGRIPGAPFLMLLGGWWIANGILNAVSRFDYRGFLAVGYVVAGAGFIALGLATGEHAPWFDAAGIVLELAGIGLVAAGTSLRRLFIANE